MPNNFKQKEALKPLYRYMNDHHPSGSEKKDGYLARIAVAVGKSVLLLSLISVPLSMTSCTTDAYGNTAVTPGGAAAIGIGAAAAGAITASAISNHNNDRHYHSRPPHHHPRPHYRNPHRRYHR